MIEGMTKMQQACNEIEVLKDASLASQNMFLELGILKDMEKDEQLYAEKEKVSKFYFLISGYAALYKINGHQEKKIVSICSAGEIINEQIMYGETSAIYAEMLSKGQVLVIDKNDMRRIMSQDYQFTEQIMKSMALKLRRLYQEIRTVSNPAYLDKLLAAKIWKLAKNYGKDTDKGRKIDFELTVPMLTEMIDEKREVIAKQLKILTEKRLIVIDNQYFTVPDMDALKRYV